MNRVLIALLAGCMITTAMVPRNRRALNSEEETFRPSTESANKICDPQTPCAWSVYKNKSRMIELNITNTYCQCGSDSVCGLSEDDTIAGAYVFRCKSTAVPVETPES